jgi:hypothetical protein
MTVCTEKDFVESQLTLLRLKYLGEKISRGIEEADFDHEKKGVLLENIISQKAERSD